VAFVGPSGNFPLNDDFSYAIATRTLVTTGLWKPTDWTSAQLISNALWAAPICGVSPCGFDDLRLTTLLASVLLFSATFFLVELNSKETILPLVAALLVAFNPIAYNLSFTFMTDILFSALVTTSALLFITSLNRDSVPLAALGTIVALAATLSREIGLCIPIAYLVVRLLQAGKQRKSVLALFPLILCVASLVLYNGWLQESGRTPAFYNAKLEDIAIVLKSPASAISRISRNLITVLLYLGLFSLPMLLLTRRPTVVATADSWSRRVPFVTAVGAVVLAVIIMVARHRVMPVGMNILIPQGVGPLTLRDTSILGLPNVPSLPYAFWIAVTLISVWGAFELTCRVATYAVNTVSTRWYGVFEPGETSALFVAIAILAYFPPLLMLTNMYDEYLIPVLPLTLFFVASISGAGLAGRYRIVTAAALCVLTAVFAVLSAHDYMAWNRARWAAITDLQNTGKAGPANLDGGFEYNGLFIYDPLYQKSHEKNWWLIGKDDDYQIAFGPIEGMKIINDYPYETFLPPAKRSILVLSK
jgi:hypothetical protein